MAVEKAVFMGHHYLTKAEGIALLEGQIVRQTAKGKPIGAEAAAVVLEELKGLSDKALAEEPFLLPEKLEAARTELGYFS